MKYRFSPFVKYRFILLPMLLFILGCAEKQPDAQQIVDKAIAAHGGDKYNKSVISFRLRDRQYRALRDNGAFVYSRTFTDSTGGRVHDVLQNSGFSRSIDEVKLNLPAAELKTHSASLNAVIYFALLPYFLNDAAAQKKYIGEATLAGEPYFKVQVTFKQEGGGEGYEDEYVYWFHQKRHTMDYLAYSFKENGGGSRFRKVANAKEVGGIRFQDYLNYTSKAPIKLAEYDKAFEAGTLEQVSEINLEEIQVEDVKN